MCFFDEQLQEAFIQWRLLEAFSFRHEQGQTVALNRDFSKQSVLSTNRFKHFHSMESSRNNLFSRLGGSNTFIQWSLLEAFYFRHKQVKTLSLNGSFSKHSAFLMNKFELFHSIQASRNILFRWKRLRAIRFLHDQV